MKMKNFKYQNYLWIAVKAVLRGKFIALKFILEKKKGCISNLSFPLRKLEKQEKKRPKETRRKEIINMKPRLLKLKTEKL